MSATTPVSLTDQSRVQRQQNVLQAEVDDETVLMSIESGAYFGLNGIGSEIWRRLDEPVAIGDVIAGLSRDFEGDPDTISAHVLEFLSGLDRKGLISAAP